MKYNTYLKLPARQLRSNQTQAEIVLWQRLRRQQIHGVRFYRQRPLDRFIVDFYCPKAFLVIECDGCQHHSPEGLYQDQQRDKSLQQKGFEYKLKKENKVAETGVRFLHKISSWEAVIAQAKKENKYIFVDCFTTWCGPSCCWACSPPATCSTPAKAGRSARSRAAW